MLNSAQTFFVALTLAACLAPALAGRTLSQQSNTMPDPNGPITTAVTAVTIDGLQDSAGATCRAEPVCLSQVCNPKAYQNDMATAGDSFPYSVSYTTTNDATLTSFLFMVCSKSGGETLTSFQLRMRDDMLEIGAGLEADPQGKNWASCNPQGPGYKWDGAALGDIGVTAGPACGSFKVMANSDVGKPASLADICQQNITIVDNKKHTVFDATSMPANCFFTFETSSGNTGFGTVMAQLEKTADKEESVQEELVAEDGKVQAYGRRRRLTRTASSRRPSRLF